MAQKPLRQGETYFIKNMVCDRCIRVVKEEFEKIDLDVRSIKLGEVTVEAGKGEIDRELVRSVLLRNGFELIDDKRVRIIEKIKTLIIDTVQHTEKPFSAVHFSTYLKENIGMEYSALSRLFSSIENVTIERYIILQKIERVKELLVYGELTLSEIADRLGYSSVQHLSNQFKQVTGFTPRYYKQLRDDKRRPLDKVV